MFGAKEAGAKGTQASFSFIPRDNNRVFLETLAEHVAVSVMGPGYGTGNYELYGRAVLDLASGRVSDDNQAPKPKNPPGFESEDERD